MSENAKVKELAANHFSSFQGGGLKPKIDGCIIKFHVEQLCDQDIDWMYEKKKQFDGKLAINIRRSGTGQSVLFGVAKLVEA